MWGLTGRRSKPKEYAESTEPQRVGASSRSNAERYGSGEGWETHEGSPSASQDQAKEKLKNIKENGTELTPAIQRLKAMQLENLVPFVTKLEALRFQLNKNHLTGAQKTYTEIAELIPQPNNELTQEQRLIRQAWEKLHNNGKGDAWKAIENQGWTITPQGPYRFELTCDQEQQLSIADAQAFLRERIADNLIAKIQDGLIEHLADSQTPEPDKGLFRNALAVVSDPANRGKGCYECGNVTVRLYQLSNDPIKLYCLQRASTQELYVVSNTTYGEKVFEIRHQMFTKPIGQGGISQSKGRCDIGIDGQNLKKSNKINFAVEHNFIKGRNNRKINVVINNNSVYITDNLIELSKLSILKGKYIRDLATKKKPGWTYYKITGFDTNESEPGE